MKKITAALLIGLTSQAQAEIHWNVSGAFEYDHVSIQDADTTDDLTKAEITISAEIDEQVSAEIVTAGIDEETDEDSTVDDDIEVDLAILTYHLENQKLSLDIGLWEAPVGQFETLSTSDPLGLAEVETTRNRGLILNWSPIEDVKFTAFSGSMDDTESTNVSGGNIELSWEMFAINIGHISDTAGDISDDALIYAVMASYDDFTLIAEGVEMGDTDNTKFTQIELNYSFAVDALPITIGLGQSTQSQSSADDTIQTHYAAAMALTENLSLTLDHSNLEQPGEKDIEQTSLKVAFEF